MIIKNINFKYNDNEIYKNFNIEFKRGKINCIIGKSGCGKTTLLNYISQKYCFENKKIAFVFQNDNLIPWENIYVNLKIIAKQYFDKEKIEKEIDKILKDIGLIEFKNSYPNELSGGMRQRINFARALIGSPDIILMDEPFKSLDIKSKHEMINLVMELRKKSIVTIILVTHSIDEIIKLSDIVYLLGGRPVRILETAEGVKIKNIVENLYKSIDEFN
ncbi:MULTISPECIES: ABC transporter ATP-binding protein [Clostridium]|jgi:NitT/TauT family transport system ATP-binding protein|uniref:Aliphatic sulfonates import ATP-binding protein SsuB n=2 Tax=Clostridia TaxID=186801 RepID=A0A174J1V2_9CLOT|nr:MULTISPECIES: ABC transporter ATP-binding protein [Clostridium]MDU3514909.1 ABC transporter ATP-binding protein [Veillonella sp.]MBX9186452.1 ABC transporter ATP-binding protein [Clostridium sp. K04]MDU3523376.1 ABC transporter ATP-binding protein [Clostridium saudiense]MDU7455892.1 ABC transporter ATP-binding protein [Clostridium saudiense]CUO91079.1 aliphatic sulfonates import ATP-binding protein SsuB [Clostridium disporicum]